MFAGPRVWQRHPERTLAEARRLVMDGGRSSTGINRRRIAARDRWQRAASRVIRARRRPGRVAFRPYARPTTNVPIGVPDTRIVHLRYTGLITLDPTVSASAVHVFAANGMYDPDITATGHQPLWFDEWMGMYYHYTVTESSIKVVFSTTAVGATAGQNIVGVHLDSSSSTDTTVSPPYYCEQGNTTWKTTSNAYNGANTVVSATGDNAAFWRMPKKTYEAEDQFRGTNSTNPTEGNFWHVFATPFGGVDTSAVKCIVEIVYTAKLMEPRSVSAS